MRRPAKKGANDVRTPGETTSVEPIPSAEAETTLAELISSAPDAKGGNAADPLATKGIATTDPLADAHVELTRAFGLLLTMPEVELALRHSGGWYGARNMLFRHQELARARGAQ